MLAPASWRSAERFQRKTAAAHFGGDSTTCTASQIEPLCQPPRRGVFYLDDSLLPAVALASPRSDLPTDPVNEIMALYGQEGYRRLERQSVERIVATSDALVLAVAGGIVSEPETFTYLLRHYHTVWLKARPEEHMSRVRAQGLADVLAAIRERGILGG